MESSTATSSASASATTTGTSAELSMPPQFKVVGIILAVVSGLLIGASFVFKKKGLVQSQQGHEAGEGVAYLKSGLWWTGMIMMILGEICNFAAYAFVEAIVVTPLGALSVVICAILSSFFLNEKLTFFGWVGCFLCIVGSVIIALNGPKEQTVGQIREFQKLFISVGFLVYGGVVIAASIIIIFFVAPRWGKQNMIWYILVCSLIGGLSVSCTQGLGASIVTSIRGDNQFTYWFTYFLLVFVIITLLTEVYYLNVALALFNTAMVTPTYYVIFTFCTLVTSVILFRGFNATPTDIITVVMGFLVICAGITILQMSKVDPTTLSGLDRKTTILLAANRPTSDTEKGDSTGMEEPGIDALRGSFGAIGSIIRARSIACSKGTVRSRRATHGHLRDDSGGMERLPSVAYMKRHQLFDNPIPPLPEDAAERISMHSNVNAPKKSTTIQFRDGDLEGHDHTTGAPDLPLDDIIQRTASPRQQPLYDDPYAYSPSRPQQGYDPSRHNGLSFRQDSLASLPERTASNSPEGMVTPPRRNYPPNREMDREESMSLVGPGRERDSGEMGYDQNRQSTSTLGPPTGPNGGIRLVPSLPRR
ncbi:magnesium transporter NIPA protein [Rhizoctonia solani AG-3 Rhs1AP]|uniref:Magnesium transporter NIPA protein n=1 Tax=Rhizoctonia solani AG-3 Rhs1AP TaxID=1086054 RepID=X8JBK4_9AGAM|nr:magnesium transporter NIPA protein [Rhizoctonia solani AG-3 Rhs1AP]